MIDPEVRDLFNNVFNRLDGITSSQERHRLLLENLQVEQSNLMKTLTNQVCEKIKALQVANTRMSESFKTLSSNFSKQEFMKWVEESYHKNSRYFTDFTQKFVIINEKLIVLQKTLSELAELKDPLQNSIESNEMLSDVFLRLTDVPTHIANELEKILSIMANFSNLNLSTANAVSTAKALSSTISLGFSNLQEIYEKVQLMSDAIVEYKQILQQHSDISVKWMETFVKSQTLTKVNKVKETAAIAQSLSQTAKNVQDMIPKKEVTIEL